MGRPLREISPTGIYHVMLRGVNKQRIFEDLEDYNAFIRIVRKSLTTDKWGNKLDTPNFDLYAYCLMDNHVHLLIGTRIISISDVVKRIASTYARVFNERYERVGHFFQDRFRSEIVCDEEYFFHLMSYIHLNPVNGDLCRLPDEYAFSSFNELTGYYTKVSDTKLHTLCDLSNIQERIGTITSEVVKEYLLQVQRQQHLIQEAKENAEKHHGESAKISFAEEDFTHLPEVLISKLKMAIKAKADRDIVDELVVQTILILADAVSITDFQRYDKKTIRSVLGQIRETGVSIRQLSRISGISVGIIRNCKPPQMSSDIGQTTA